MPRNDEQLAEVRRSAHPQRRQFLKLLGGVGVGATVFGRALTAIAQDQPRVTPDMIRQAEWIAGLSFTDEQRQTMARGATRSRNQYARLREVELDNGVAPALYFDPAADLPAGGEVRREKVHPIKQAAPKRPSSDDDLAFAPVSELAGLIRTRAISSVELTRLYLDRLLRFGPILESVITRTEDLALRQAERADREIAAGRYRGPLHGIPWGAKDLLAVPGYPTTWGAKPYENQTRDETATVAARLEAAGAVLVAKLSVGALAMGDVWYGGRTRNPWNPEQGSSGSSAGPAAATVAGLVGCSIGTETLGSIISPCTRCGATGLRPTFGRVSRYGCMTLTWSMDKIGPICRSVEGCALVFSVIHGADGLDPTAVDRPFAWPPKRDIRKLRVGYLEGMLDEPDSRPTSRPGRRGRGRGQQRAFDRATLEVLRGLGVKLRPIKLPDTYPVGALNVILNAESSAAFDDLTRSGRDKLLVRQGRGAWPDSFRQGQLIPAVEYIRANRIRTLVMRQMQAAMKDIDVYVAPTFGGSNLLLTNLTGHPAVVLPNGFRKPGGTPTSITFTGSLYGESDLLALAHAYQQATGFHLERPSLDPAAESE